MHKTIQFERVCRNTYQFTQHDIADAVIGWLKKNSIFSHGDRDYTLTTEFETDEDGCVSCKVVQEFIKSEAVNDAANP